ncbi:hypothetical protein L1049_015963 [Liquidambar formosana]|uniref:Beta-galactosidase n=1 Tax=Liquidambar formosana TaxID=63359 RepID=A0AAP0X288_LIQFO
MNLMQMWEDLIQKAKDGGLDVIDTYVFWNVHEPSPGNMAMQRFTQKVVQMMKDEKLFESQGGPIILSQIENEYEPESKAFGTAGYAYMTWAAKMAVGMGTGVPWVMCKEDDAPDPVINTCNGFYCDYFSPNKPYKPTMWTEAWSGWFTEFGGPIHQRPVEDLAFAVARFIKKGGSFVNYYMYHGGTNFGRTAGGPFITTSYDYDAPIDEYGLIRQPKHGHLKDLHRAIKLCERALVSADPTVTSLGNYEQAHVFSTESGDCAAFLSNYNSKSAARVTFQDKHYNLPPWSVSILPDCKNVVFNTANVGVQTTQMQMLPTNAQLFSWETFKEDIVSVDEDSEITVIGLLEQLNVTRDISDYLWYTTRVEISSSESFLHGDQHPTLTVQSTGHAMHVFINGYLSGSAFGTRENRRFTFKENVDLDAGTNIISLLSIAVGLPNNGPHFETWNTGVLGPVVLNGLDEGKRDLSWQKWSYQVGLKGEAMNLASPNGISSVDWMRGSLVAQKNQPLTWYKAYFKAPKGGEPLALDMGSMGRVKYGSMGRVLGDIGLLMLMVIAMGAVILAHFDLQSANLVVVNQLNDGKKFSQTLFISINVIELKTKWKIFHTKVLKIFWAFQPTQNLLVLFEEIGGDASKISLVKRSVTGLCAEVSEYHPTTKNWLIDSYGKSEVLNKPEFHLRCAAGQSISAIKFASFGTPFGTCGSFQQGTCHAPTSYAVVEKKCLGQQNCSVTISKSNFGADPCPNVVKKLSAEAVCAPIGTTTAWPNSRV